MKLKLEFNKMPFVVLHYDEDERKRIEEIMSKRLNLEVAETERGFGSAQKCKYFREQNSELKQYLDAALFGSEMRYIDNINEPVFSRGQFNIAILRVIPEENGVVKLRLDKFLNILELQQMVNGMREILENLFSMVISKEVKLIMKER